MHTALCTSSQETSSHEPSGLDSGVPFQDAKRGLSKQKIETERGIGCRDPDRYAEQVTADGSERLGLHYDRKRLG